MKNVSVGSNRRVGWNDSRGALAPYESPCSLSSGPAFAPLLVLTYLNTAAGDGESSACKI
jgi:hypothetical protein